MDFRFLKQPDIDQLEQYQRKALKQLQHHPERTQMSASLALLSIATVETVLLKNMLGLFWGWLASEGKEKEICFQQLSMKALPEAFGLTRSTTWLNDMISPPFWT